MIAWLPVAAVAVTAVASPRHAWRWWTGLPLDGPPGRPRYRTDASWNLPATKRLHPVPVTRWHWWRRRRRAGIRGGGTLAVLGVAEGLLTARTLTLVLLALLTAAGMALAARPAARKVTGWRHHRAYVQPLTAALRRELGAAPERLAIEPDRSAVVMTLPEEFTGSPRDREAITRAVTAKVGELEPDWSGIGGRKPQVAFARSQPPPANVTLRDIEAAAHEAAEHEIIQGIGRRGEIVRVSVDNDSPHLGLSMGSGDGKSTVAKNQLAQLLHHGALGVILDIKLISHMWARGLPNVAYAGTPAEIESTLVWLSAEVARRNTLALKHADIEGIVHANPGARIFIIAEELNATQNRLKAWWNREMEMKGRSPGSEALDDVMFLGRQVLCNVEQIGQRLSVKASGSGDARENMGVLIFKDPTASAWKMLVGDRHPMPPASGHRGRLQIVTRSAVRETQGAYLTGQQARHWALSGTVAVPPAGMPCVTAIGPVTSHPAIDAGPDVGVVVGQRPVAPAIPGAVTLREAADAGLWPSLAAARKASTRPGFPEPVGVRDLANLYDLAELKVRTGR